MQNNILVQGKGILTKVAVDAKNGYDAFKSKRNKRLFIEILKDEGNENVCLVAYCVIEGSAHFIVKGNSKTDIDYYIAKVSTRFGTEYDNGKASFGYPLRPECITQKISSADLMDAIAYVHSLAPVSPEDYEFNSYEYLSEGSSGATAVIIAENGGNLSRSEFLAWLESGSKKHYKQSSRGKEKFNAVLKDSKKRYLNYHSVEEAIVVFVLAELCDRTGCRYKRAARALGISYKKRRDVMIATLCELMQRRHHSFGESISIMNLNKEDRTTLLMDCIVELNRLHKYSYDHIISVFGVSDFYYDILVEILRGLHRRFNFNFEEMCLMFHLQNEIISIRTRCGF